MRVVARAIIRSEIEPIFSEGFNPHLRLSLPMPRNVGLASDDELFCVKIKPKEYISIKELLAKQLPEGFELLSADLTGKSVSYQPIEVEYFVKLNLQEKRHLIEKINGQIQAGEQILIERTINEEGDIKIFDAVKYLKPFELAENGIKAFCVVLPTGTIRPDEILKLLNIEPFEICNLVVRKKINWNIN